MLVSGRANVGTLTVFIGVLGGLAAFGAIGLFLGPVVLALIIALIRLDAGNPQHGSYAVQPADPRVESGTESVIPARRRQSRCALHVPVIRMTDRPFRIATRQSRLALWQAEHVAARLRERASATSTSCWCR